MIKRFLSQLVPEKARLRNNILICHSFECIAEPTKDYFCVPQAGKLSDSCLNFIIFSSSFFHSFVSRRIPSDHLSLV